LKIPADFRPRRVLVLRLRGLGDVVLSSGVVEALGRAYPEAAIDFLSGAPSRALREADPRLDGVFLRDDRASEREGRVQSGSRADAVRWIRRRRPDLVVDLFSNPVTALFTALSGARWRIGLSKRLRALAYNVRVPRFRGAPEDDHRYAGDVQLDFLRDAGIRWEGDARARVFLEPDDREFADRALRDLGYRSGAPFGAVLPGGSWASKRWRPGGFAEVGAVLARELGQPTLVVWGPPERDDAVTIAAALGADGRLAPPSTLRRMAALLGRPALLVATDCLGRHFAIVQDVPTVGIFGSTDPSDWTPRDGPHRAVGGPGEGSVPLRDLPAEPVVLAARSLLDERRLDARDPPS
jgi:ADP-heptose:LPS heptosyltransferase